VIAVAGRAPAPVRAPVAAAAIEHRDFLQRNEKETAMNPSHLDWSAALRRYLILGLALSAWHSRPPTAGELREFTALAREWFSAAPRGRPAAGCCSPTVALCCVVGDLA
jgi:hypothetical protein